MTTQGLLPGMAPEVEVLLDDRARGCRVTYERGFLDAALA